jgi:integrase
MEFTRASVASAKCHAERAQTFYWDTVTPVLGLRVTRAGAKSFVFESKLGGKTIRITIGPATLQIRGVKAPYRFGADLEAARLAGLVAQGIDPRAEKADRVAAQEADRETVRQERAKRDVSGLDAWFVYCEDRRPHWGERHHDDHLLMVQPGGAPRQRAKGKATKPGLLLALLDRPLAQVDARAVDEWVSRETKVRPTRTALGFRMVRAFLNWAGEHPEFGDIAKADAHRPKRTREKLARKAAKSDVLQREMLKGWFAEVGKLSPSMSAVLQFMLLTGCRPGEALDMRWKDVDFVWQSLTLRDKVVGERIVPLTQHVAKLLFELRRVNSIRPNLPRRLDGDAAAQAEHEKWEPSPWVFVSRVRTGERVTVPRNAHGQALTAAGLPHVSLHGLRRSFGTLSEWCETPIGIVAQIQGHAPSAIAERHYRVRPLDLLRQWHQRIEVFILAEAGIEPAAAHEPNRPALALVHKNPEIACFSAQMGGIAAA